MKELYRGLFSLSLLCWISIGYGLLAFTSSNLLDHEKDAKEQFYQLEEELGKEISDIKQYDCTKEKGSVAKCKFVKYQIKTSGDFTYMYSSYYKLLSNLGILLFILALAAYGYANRKALDKIFNVSKKRRKSK